MTSCWWPSAAAGVDSCMGTLDTTRTATPPTRLTRTHPLTPSTPIPSSTQHHTAHCILVAVFDGASWRRSEFRSLPYHNHVRHGRHCTPLVHLRPDKVPQQSLAEIAQRPFLFPPKNITSAACQNPATIHRPGQIPRGRGYPHRFPAKNGCTMPACCLQISTVWAPPSPRRRPEAPPKTRRPHRNNPTMY
jgi:hypothetical protein